jgi:iron complex outermembrane receptor protein
MTRRRSGTLCGLSVRGLLTAAGSTVLLAEMMAASPAFCQEAAGPASALDDTQEIVVTAQKRAENVQNVPVAVQVISNQELQANDVRSFSDLTRVAPSLIVRPADQPVNSSISVRGIGTFAFSINVEPSVAVQVDDVPIAFQARAFTNLSDIERIEVLRGPQSTLYGKSASAGLINIVTKKPSSTFTAHVGALATTDNDFQWNLGVSGPLGDTLGFRVTGNWNKFKGNVTNLFDNSTVNGRESVSINGKLRWEPTSNLWVEGALDYINGSTTLGQPFIALSPDARLTGVASLNPTVFAPGIVASRQNTTVSNNFPGGTDYNSLQQALRVGYDFGWATLVSISSHDKYTLYDRLDPDNTALTAVDVQQTGTITSSQWTQELRLVSDGVKPLRYTLGLFYADVSALQIRDRGPVGLTRYTATSGSLQKAAFAQLEYDITGGLTAIGGIRYGADKASYTFLDRRVNASFAGSDSRDYETHKASLRYKIIPAINIYGTFATGRKGQAYDLSTGFNAARAAAGPVLPETSKSWELGIRSQFFDHKLTLNATVFTADYINFQAQGIETLPDGTLNFRLTNVGAIRTRGVEAEAFLRPSRDLNIGGSLAYLDAVITNFPFAQCYPGQTAAQGCTGAPARQNLVGFRPPQAPRWKWTANIDYLYRLDGKSFGIATTAAFSYQSTIRYALSQDPETEQKGFGILNLSLGLRANDRKWDLMAFVNNATDQHYYANISNSAGTFGNKQATTALVPRDFDRYAGIRFSYNY